MRTLKRMKLMASGLVVVTNFIVAPQVLAQDQSQAAPSSAEQDPLGALLDSAPASDSSSSTPASAGQSAPEAASQSEPASEPATTSQPESQSAEAAPAPAPAADDALPVMALPQKKDESLASQPSAKSNPRQIEEIVVTATKREEAIRDIPQSISAFSGEALENQGKIALDDFLKQAPGVTTVQAGGGFTRVTMRGISTDTNPYAGNPSPVGFFIGDSAFTDPYIANIVPDLSAFDLSGVQVLKGPQGTLFGGAALSGAVRYELQEPVLGEWQARAFSQYSHPDGGGQAFTSGAALNLPIFKDQNVAVRLAYVHRAYPGVYDNLRTGQNNVNYGSGNQVRGIALWQPIDDLKIKVTHLTQDYSSDDELVTADTPDGPRQSNNEIAPAWSHNKFKLDSLEGNYNFDSVRLVSLSSWLGKNAAWAHDLTPVLIGTPPQGYPESLTEQDIITDNSKSFSQEVRLQSTGDGPFQWLVGAYFFNYRLYFNILIDNPTLQGLTGPGSVIGDNPLLNTLLGALGLPSGSLEETTALLNGTSNARSKERAIFMDYSYKGIDDLEVSLGARFYKTSVSGGFVGSGLLLNAENNGMNSDTSASLSEKGISPKFSATYHFTSDVSLYTTIARGFRFGGLQDVPSTPTNGVPATFKSDSMWSYEMGLRTDWLDNTLQADLTAFFIDYKDPIITQATQGVPISYSTNVSGAVSRGLESSFLWNTPIDGLTLSANGAFTDAHITKPFTASDGTLIQPGQEMPGTARYQYGLSAAYMQPVYFMLVGTNVSYNYIGKGYSDISHTVTVNDYGTLNAGLNLSAPGLLGNPKIAVNLTNILNVTKPVAGGITKALVTQQEVSSYALTAPRSISVRLSLDF